MDGQIAKVFTVTLRLRFAARVNKKDTPPRVRRGKHNGYRSSQIAFYMGVPPLFNSIPLNEDTSIQRTLNEESIEDEAIARTHLR